MLYEDPADIPVVAIQSNGALPKKPERSDDASRFHEKLDGDAIQHMQVSYRTAATRPIAGWN